MKKILLTFDAEEFDLPREFNQEISDDAMYEISKEGTEMSYVVETTEAFEKEFAKKHRDKVDWLKKIKEKLKENPEYGKPLRGRLHGLWQLRIGSFRVWYEINHIAKKVILKAIYHKDEAVKHY